MPYYDLQGGGSPVNNTSTIILTKENNPLKFKAGYYTAFDLTTNVGDAKAKKIVYRHHQCSTSQSNLTYDDGTFNTNGAKAVSNLTVQNGQTVSTVKGGCYQTPYYKYTYTIDHPAESGGYCQQVGYGSRPDVGGSYPIYECSKCHYRQVGGQWHHDCSKPAWKEYRSGYTTNKTSGVEATYYLKSCPYSNGQTLSAEITY
jgi:hypothetical protein